MGKKSKKLKKGAAAESKTEKKSTPTEEEKNSFDFGGLPQRDLKKNLGCG